MKVYFSDLIMSLSEEGPGADFSNLSDVTLTPFVTRREPVAEISSLLDQLYITRSEVKDLDDAIAEYPRFLRNRKY